MPEGKRASEEEWAQASEKNVKKMQKFVESFAEKSGTFLHPEQYMTDLLVIGLARNIDEVGRPLCPCNHYDDKAEEAKSSVWSCPCEEMQRWKYCH